MWFANTERVLYKKDGDLHKALSKALGIAKRRAREAAAQLELSTEKVTGKQTIRMTLKCIPCAKQNLMGTPSSKK